MPALVGWQEAGKERCNVSGYWTSGATETSAIMYRISSLNTAAAKHGPDSFGFALQQIEEAARGFWKQASA